MRVVITVCLSCVLAMGATCAFGQFGLYGSPEILQFAPQMRPAQMSAGTLPAAYAPMGTGVASPMIRAYSAQRYGAAAPGTAPTNTRPLTPIPRRVPQGQRGAGILNQPLGSADYLNSGGNGVAGGDCYGVDCEPSCYQAPCCPWYGGAFGLMMCRNQANRLWTSYQTGNNANQTQNSQMGIQWRGGGEIRFGRYFCCRQWAVEATYWTLDNFSAYSSSSVSPSVSTPLDFGFLQFGPGDPLSIYFDTSAEHRLWRNDEIHNLEVNFIRHRMLAATYLPWDVSWSAGIRWLRFKEDFTFGALEQGRTWGEAGGSWEAYLQDDITNDLVGFQIGCEASYYLHGAWRFFVAPNIGLYNNHISNRFRLNRGDGVVAVATDPGITGTYPVNSSKDILSFMTELDIGLDWQCSQRWSARIGYRVLFISGIGLAEEQVPHYIVDIPEIAAIDHNATLILHGAFAGLTYNY